MWRDYLPHSVCRSAFWAAQNYLGLARKQKAVLSYRVTPVILATWEAESWKIVV
jgi:hypothetical protein